MDTKIAYSHGRHGGGPTKVKVYSNKVCQFWLAGRCNRNPCRFLHREFPTSQRQLPSSSNNSGLPPTSNVYRRTPKQPPNTSNSNYASKSSEPSLDPPNKRSRGNNIPASTSKCEYTSMEVNMDCSKNSDAIISPVVEPSTKDSFSMLAQLKGHNKAICGIALPSGSDKLYSASNDGIVNVWDCNSGHSTRTINLGGTIGCLIGEGSWIFVGMYNSIKAWNIKTQMEYTLLGDGNESFGLVYAMDTIDDMLFSGGQDGSILAWKGSDDNLKPFKLAACLKGHTACVTCLAVGTLRRLYSGSTDGTIRVWDRDTMKCLHMLRKEHTNAVMSLICWKEYLLSCSLDNKIIFWAQLKENNVCSIDVVYTHDVKQGAIAMCGMDVAEDKPPILLCSCIDGCTTLIDLPSLQERGRIRSNDEVRRIAIGPGGLFFTGEALGTLKVWQLAGS